jgi:hypothetical protein
VEAVNKDHLLLLRRFLLILVICMRKRLAEPGLEVRIRVKDRGQEEVEQIPQLGNVVLEWCACENVMCVLILFCKNTTYINNVT